MRFAKGGGVGIVDSFFLNPFAYESNRAFVFGFFEDDCHLGRTVDDDSACFECGFSSFVSKNRQKDVSVERFRIGFSFVCRDCEHAVVGEDGVGMVILPAVAVSEFCGAVRFDSRVENPSRVFAQNAVFSDVFEHERLGQRLERLPRLPDAFMCDCEAVRIVIHGVLERFNVRRFDMSCFSDDYTHCFSFLLQG